MTLKKFLKNNPNITITKTDSGYQGEIRPSLFGRVDLTKNLCNSQCQKQQKQS